MTGIKIGLLGLTCALTILLLSFLSDVQTTEANNQIEVGPSRKVSWTAKWIAPKTGFDKPNTWACFRKTFDWTDSPGDSVFAKIAVDSKYWLWINGERVVFEGGLKRGPSPSATYYDRIDVSPYLQNGENSIALLVWYFGKQGFSHLDSGQGGLLFEMKGKSITLVSDADWEAWIHPAFGNTDEPHPNYRLPESNILFDARKGNFDFTSNEFSNESIPADKSTGSDTSSENSEEKSSKGSSRNDAGQPNAVVLGNPGTEPWGELVARPIPQWKDFELASYLDTMEFPFVSKGDTLKMKLPYNAQVTPYLEINASSGQRIDIRTDNYRGGGPPNVRAEYITRDGEQSYENFGWMNGHEVWYTIPKGIEVLDLKYRETGYDTEFAGRFSCNEDFYNRLWGKSLRTLYVTMRDTYLDCPDRERAQWWGDEVLESGEAFYALSPTSHALAKKGIRELINWQRPDSTIFSPVPAGNWENELPTQMLSSVGTFGFWNYYWHTGDRQTLADVYDGVERYLAVWKLEENGTVRIRKGGWTWGDWGENKDMPLLFNTQYYMALDSFKRMSELLDKTTAADSTSSLMENFKIDFNRAFWNGSAYRSDSHTGETDDRAQGLAVVAGLADENQFPAIYKVLQNERHASSYMEKYILEALFQMGYTDFALKRMRERFVNMVEHPWLTTMWEGWGIGSEGYGGGTINHAWSGGGLTLLSQYVGGIYPTSPGYSSFQIKPQLGFLKEVDVAVPTVKGLIKASIRKEKEFTMDVEIPPLTEGHLYIEENYSNISVNGKSVPQETIEGYRIIKLKPGKHDIIAN